eukprot:12603844-Alexandrium_andersonii.AAC.1
MVYAHAPTGQGPEKTGVLDVQGPHTPLCELDPLTTDIPDGARHATTRGTRELVRRGGALPEAVEQ